MPAADDLISDFDDFHDSQPPPEPAPLPAKKSKKKKKHAVQARPRVDEEDDSGYPKSVTPSPPVNLGVRLDTPPPPAPEPPAADSELDDVPLADEQDELHPFAWDNETTAVEEPAPAPEATLAQPLPVRSPRPATVQPVTPAASSPPYRPASSRRPSQPYPGLGSYRLNNAPVQPTTQRRESFARSPKPRLFDPPPPHMPQPHYFGLPDFGLGLTPKTENGKIAGSDGHCLRFDTLADAGDAIAARRAKDVLLVGLDCGLEVYKVTPEKVDLAGPAGRLEGLRGAVIDAKILPHTSIYDSATALRPLVGVVVHGPVQEEREDGDREQQTRPTIYQTTVEVYSFQTLKHIATLYKSTTAKMEQPVVGHLSLPPKPVGDLNLDAAGKFVTLSSGKSGEVFVFTSHYEAGEEKPSFRCVAKYWTALQTRQETPRPQSANSTPASDTELQARVPLMSLSARWLAIVPPYTSPGSSVQGTPTTSDSHALPYGLGTHAAPSQPPLMCEVAGVDTEGTLSWLSRKAAQGLVTASQRGKELTLAGWNELTNPAPPAGHQKNNLEPSMFPPTNAPADDPRRLAKEPALVSIIDLQKLLGAEEQRLKQAPAPLATFALVEGCNFVSFSSDGLRLLTSNRKGEVSHVWYLAHMAHGSTKLSEGDEAEAERVPHVKLLHQIPRNSQSVTVDSVWSRDGDWVALLTTHGTVHLHEVPLTASKKRKRRPTVSAPVPTKVEPTVSLSHSVSPPSNGFLGGFRSWTQSLSTQVNTAKTQYAIPTTFAGFRETATAARTASQRAVAKGISQGYTAAKSGASDMWHAEDNKIRLKTLPDGGARHGYMHWVQRQSSSILALANGGNVYLHPVERVMRRQGEVMVSGLKKDKYNKNWPLPRISTNRDGAKASSCAKQGPHGFWNIVTAYTENGKIGRAPSGAAATPATNANEVETNPPYCPFHVDQRISIYSFEESGYASQINVKEDALLAFTTRGHGDAEYNEPWLFGGPLPASTKLNERTHDEQRPRPNLRGGYAESEDDMVGMIESRLSIRPATEGEEQQIQVESRLSRRGGRQLGRSRDEGGDVAVEDDDMDSFM